MARQARLAIAGHPHHLMVKGNNGQGIFVDDEDRRRWLQQLADTLREHALVLHAYVLMPNHVHLLLTPPSPQALSRAMQALGRRYVSYFNARHHRTGTLWEGRFRAHPVGEPLEVLRCMRFIETNPLRAGLVLALPEAAWSSLPHHLGATRDALITEPAAYWQLGNTPFERDAAYRAWVDQGVPADETRRLMAALRGGRPLGSATYVAELEALTARSLRPRPRGRPRKLRPNTVPI